MVDAPEAATKVKKIHDLLVAGNITALDILLCSYTAPDFMEHGTKIKKPADLYLYNFFPIAAGKSDDFVLQSKDLSAEKIARANPGFNKKLGKPVSSPLTVGDMNQYYQMTGMI